VPPWLHPTARGETRVRSASGPIRHRAVRAHCSPSLPEHRGRPCIGCTTPGAVVVDCATARAPCIRQAPLRAFRPACLLRLETFGGRTHASHARSTRPRARGRQCDGEESGSSSRVAGPLDYRSRRGASDRFGHVRIAQRVSRACFSKLLGGISITLVGVPAGKSPALPQLDVTFPRLWLRASVLKNLLISRRRRTSSS
jgi:hypothetical protein